MLYSDTDDFRSLKLGSGGLGGGGGQMEVNKGAVRQIYSNSLQQRHFKKLIKSLHGWSLKRYHFLKIRKFVRKNRISEIIYIELQACITIFFQVKKSSLQMFSRSCLTQELIFFSKYHLFNKSRNNNKIYKAKNPFQTRIICYLYF